MTKERRLYWRWKGNQYILEGRLPNKKAVTLWTLPNANTIIKMLKSNAAFFTPEKKAEILEIYERLEYKSDKKPKGFSKRRLISIVRPFSNDALEEPSEEDIEASLEEVDEKTKNFLDG